MDMHIRFRCPECGGDQFANIVQPKESGTGTDIINKCVGTKRGAERQRSAEHPTYDAQPCGFTWRALESHTVMILEMKFETAREYELACRAVQGKNTLKLLFGSK
jgi:hypothetical protein